MGITLGFRLTARRRLELAAEAINAPGAAPGRPTNSLGVNDQANVRPRTAGGVAAVDTGCRSADQPASRARPAGRSQSVVLFVDRSCANGKNAEPNAARGNAIVACPHFIGIMFGG
jgi:hypothetical protein